MELKLDRSIF